MQRIAVEAVCSALGLLKQHHSREDNGISD